MQKNSNSNWLKKAVMIVTTIGIFMSSTLSASALTSTMNLAITPSQLSVIKNSGNIQTIQGVLTPMPTKLAITNTSVTYTHGIRINFCLNTSAYITIGVAESFDNGNYQGVQTLSSSELYNNGCFGKEWDGKYASGLSAKDDGQYYFYITGVNKTNSSDKQTVTGWVDVNGEETSTDTTTTTSTDEELLISSLKVSPAKINPNNSDEADIKFTLTKTSKLTVVINEDGTNNKIAELQYKETSEKGDYKYSWDGTDDDGDIVEDGKYYVKVTAETSTGVKDIDKEDIVVKSKIGDNTNKIHLQDAFVTKDSFDTDRDEKTNIVFTTTTDSDIVVKILDGSSVVAVLYDKNDVSAGTYVVTWDGKNKNGKDLSYGTYEYKIYVDNSKGEDIESGTITIAEDHESTKTPNIYQDSSTTVFKPVEDSRMSFDFRISYAANVTIGVYENQRLIAHVADLDLDQGDNTVRWNGEDDSGSLLVDGVYSYKITASNYGGESEEWGSFMITEGYNKDYKARCAGFTDVFQDNSYCDAISWAQEKEIVTGYDDNTFRPENVVTRAEALKMVLITLNYNILDDNGSNLGFNDVRKSAWYMKYIRTAKTYGVVSGYSDGSFRPDQQVSKAEAVSMLLNAAKVKNHIIVSSCNTKPYLDVNLGDWYLDNVCYAKYYDLTEDEYYFNPNTLYTRGEMVKLLYRSSTAGILE